MDTFCKKTFMFLGHIVSEKNAMITSKIQSCTIVLINSFEILQVSIVFFSNTVRPRNLKFILYINPYAYSLQKKISFFSNTVRPRNLKFILYINPYAYSLQKKISCSSVAQISRKLRWYLEKIQSCPIVLINNFEILQVSISFLSDTVQMRNLKFILYMNPYGYSLQKNFMFLGGTVFEKNAMITCKIQSCTIVVINNIDILQDSLAFFSDTVRSRNLKFILYIKPYGYSLQKKIHVPW